MIKIIPSTNLISVIKNKYLLLDTNVFIDTLLNPHSFFDFLNDLKNQQVTLSTIDMVRMEFLKGAPDEQKYNEINILFPPLRCNLQNLTSPLFFATIGS